MNFVTGMFLVSAHAYRELRRETQKALGRPSGAGFKKNALTVKAARALLIAYAMQHRARQDIALYARMRM